MFIPPIARDGIRGVRHNSFYYRSVTTWNNLPRDVPIASLVYYVFIQTLPGFGLERQSTQISFNIIQNNCKKSSS